MNSRIVKSHMNSDHVVFSILKFIARVCQRRKLELLSSLLGLEGKDDHLGLKLVLLLSRGGLFE